jgi:hypothetical protein
MQTEIDTHLNVHHVALSNYYSSSSIPSAALDIMRTQYAASSWHHAGTDVHHALLGKKMGGGIAYLGVLCNSQYGYGLSADLVGSYQSMGNAVVWDMMVVSFVVIVFYSSCEYALCDLMYSPSNQYIIRMNLLSFSLTLAVHARDRPQLWLWPHPRWRIQSQGQYLRLRQLGWCLH